VPSWATRRRPRKAAAPASAEPGDVFGG